MTEPTSPIENSLASETASSAPTTQPSTAESSAFERVHLPRIAIKFCTQCRWMLRAAYFAQELLSTFSTDLGEVALVPMTGGVFTVTIWHAAETSASGEVTTQESLLWDRKRDGGFPGMYRMFEVFWIIFRSLGSYTMTDNYMNVEVKALKSLVRNIIAPNRDLGHTDRALKKEEEKRIEKEAQGKQQKDCEDCS
ncbi:uncharacterized protein N7482_008119 [Penicillium canariense]|uniref:Selenoprotein n=1 Tax=Penicillium canariense TaxID=189055 RepID=A0A9W9LI24_9EURO|nr:uncharacterized protein N7482_008119 [Penicillium canariense]KAJ5157019.1 hypothetical protein N7482_008119 [Penicillium canariense]